MNKYLIAVLAIFLAITGCSKSTEEICQKTNDLLVRNDGSGFTDTAMRNCLHKTNGEAERDYRATKEMYEEENKNSDLARVSRSEFKKKYSRISYVDLPKYLGEPASFEMSLINNEKATSPASRKGKLRYADFVAAYETGRPGFYFIHWKKGFTKDPIGIPDDNLVAFGAISLDSKAEWIFFANQHFWEPYVPFYDAKW